MYLSRTIARYFTPSIKGIIFLLLMVFCTSVNSQCLISNGGFERFHSDCGAYVNLNNDTFGIINTVNPFLNTFSTPDGYNACFSNLPGQCFLSSCTPRNVYGYQETHSGNGYTGIITYYPPPPTQIYREYIELKLDTILKAGSCYHFKMYCSFADSSYYICPTIGILISDTLVKGTVASVNENYIWQSPQIENDTNNWDTINWFKVEGNYLAHGGEQFITIGNFHPDSESVAHLYHSWVMQGADAWSYLYIDDVSLIPCEADTVHSEKYTICYGDSINLKLDSLAPMPASPCDAGLNYCHWYDKRHTPLYSGFSYTIKPTRDTVLYTIRGNDTCSCGYYQDSITILVKQLPCQAIDTPFQIAIPTAFSPNGDGNNDVFAPVFYQNNAAEMLMRIYNRWGEIVYNGMAAWDGKYKGALQPNDTYFYVVEINGEYFKGNVELIR